MKQKHHFPIYYPCCTGDGRITVQFWGALIFPWQRCYFSVSRGIVLWATVTLMLDSEHNTAPAWSDDLHPELHEVFTSAAICAEERV